MTSFTIMSLTDHTGAEVTGLDFTQPIDSETRAALARAFAERHVLVMRDQHTFRVIPTWTTSATTRSWTANASSRARRSIPTTPTTHARPRLRRCSPSDRKSVV